MRQGTTAFVATLIMLGGTSALNAQPVGGPPVYHDSRAYYGGRAAPPPYAYDDLAMASYEVHAVLRANGFLPLSGPARRGGFYVISAIHPSGERGKVVIDAYTGRVERFIPGLPAVSRGRNDQMVLVYQGPTFPPPDVAPVRSAAVPPPVSAARGVPRPPASIPSMASRVPPASPLVTPRPRPQAAPSKPESVQAPPVPAPVETKPAAASPPLVQKPVEKTPTTPTVQPTKPLPPVQTLE